jgi:hypothetical protein
VEASTVSVSQERPSSSGGLLEYYEAATHVHVEVLMVSASKEATGTISASEDGSSASLEDFINNITKDIPPPLVDKPPRRRRVDPIPIDVPPQLPLFEAYGLIVANMASYAISSSLILVIHDNMIIGTNHIV